MSIFVKATDTFTVDLAVADDASNPAVVHVAATKGDLPKDSVNAKDHKLVFRFPSYKDNATALDDSIDMSTGVLKFQTTMLRLHRMARLTKSWTFTDEEGKLVPISADTVGLLNPVLANYIGERMEEVLGII